MSSSNSRQNPGDGCGKSRAINLPREILDAEVDLVFDLGAQLRANDPVEDLEPLTRDFDAVLLTCGRATPEQD